MGIRLVGLDLDGTLLTNEKKISAKTMEVLEKAAALGVEFVPVTGRPFGGIPKIVKKLPFVHYIIACNGATTHSMPEGKLLREVLISGEDSRSLAQTFQGFGADFEVLCGGIGYGEQSMYDRLIDNSPNRDFVTKYVKETRKIIPSMDAFLADSEGVEEIFLMAKGNKHRDAIFAEIEHLDHIHVVFPGPAMMEITASTVDKGEALLALGESLGITRDEVMAVGDSGNDITMLKAASLSVAMENGEEAVKNLAKVVTESNEKDGVALAVQRFVLKEL